MTEPLLSLRISAGYKGAPGVLSDVRLDVRRGEIMGLIGESGSGKSTLALAILSLLEWRGGTVQGQIVYQGRDLTKLKERELRQIRGKEIGLVLQSPMSALNPALRIGTQLKEAWRCHSNARSQWEPEAVEALAAVSLPSGKEFLRKFPRQLSVGQAQRVLIAMAILHRPPLLVADEPTSALDVITQSEILDLFATLSRERDMAVLFISHDLLSVARLCDRIAILKHGELVESGETEQIFERPQHPYTQALIQALPVPGRVPS